MMNTSVWKRLSFFILSILLPQMGHPTPLAVLDSATNSNTTFVGTVAASRWNHHPTLELGAAKGQILAVDRYQKQWLHHRHAHSLRLGIRHRTSPDETDDFAQDYGYPEWAMHVMWSNLVQVKMQKFASPDWGLLIPVDYASHMGHLFAAYGSLSRPLHRHPRWQWGYALETGLAYNTHPYCRRNNIDNELTGSHLLFYFGTSLYACLRLDPHWSTRIDLGFRHVSNGALHRPNKGANSFSPTFTVQYDFDQTAVFDRKQRYHRSPFHPHTYYSAAFALGGRTLLEEWVYTQYNTDPSSPDYRKDDFDFHPTYSLQVDAMRRYARRWATGIGLDLFYMPYVGKIRRYDALLHPEQHHHHRWSLGVAAKHEAFYGRLSMYVHLGYYLSRQTGYYQDLDEKPYYERIGLRYRLPFDRNRWSMAAGIKAHATKADCSEITLTRRF